jgi:phosphoribosyl 1,2-cyclic phosphate phosphodiesterase
MNNFSLTILGCGTSTGVPVIGCRCAVCQSNVVENKRLRASAVISPLAENTADNSPTLLIDIGPDFRQQALTVDLHYLSGVLLTHAHADHILGLDDLRAYTFLGHESTQLYGDRDTLKSIRTVFSYIFDPRPEYKGGLLPSINSIEVSPPLPFSIVEKTIQPFWLSHGREKVVGYRFGTLAYATDCNEISAESREILKGTKTLVLDGLRHKPHPTHFTISEAISMAESLGVESVYLTHLSHDICYQEVSEQLPAGVSLCFDGLTLPFFW